MINCYNSTSFKESLSSFTGNFTQVVLKLFSVHASKTTYCSTFQNKNYLTLLVNIGIL